MKILSLFGSLIILCCQAIAQPRNLVVRENGANGAYSSISAAITEANPGDRIVIKPMSDGRAYVENLTISKSLTLVSEDDNAHYVVDGQILITPFSGNVVISHAKLVATVGTGEIRSTADGSVSAARTILKIISTQAKAMFINHDNYDVTAANCTFSYGASLRSGKIIGCASPNISIGNEVNPAPKVREVIELIGNRLGTPSISSGGYCIDISTDDYFFVIKNNLIQATQQGIKADGAWRNQSTYTNEIVNNTIRMSNTSTCWAFSIQNKPALPRLNIYSNIIHENVAGTGYVLYTRTCSGTIDFQYNYTNSSPEYLIYDFTAGNIIPAPTNIKSATETLPINTTTGECPATGVDMGHTETIYLDLDLSRNNVGCYGGPESMTNFWPTDTNKARVFYLSVPKRVTAGQTLEIKAEAFDF